jgi:hypothetical protein
MILKETDGATGVVSFEQTNIHATATNRSLDFQESFPRMIKTPFID